MTETLIVSRNAYSVKVDRNLKTGNTLLSTCLFVLFGRKQMCHLYLKLSK